MSGLEAERYSRKRVTDADFLHIMLVGGILMSMIFFTYRASTQARRGMTILRDAGLSGRMARTPSKIAGNGCGYGLWVPRGQAYTASMELRGRDCPYERSYLFENSAAQEVVF